MSGAMGKKGECEIEFWKKWLHAYSLEREKLAGKLPFIKTCMEGRPAKIPRSMFKRMIAFQLNLYFEDLESAAYVKERLEADRRKRRG